ncbi:MAG: hypothetical protein BWY15_01841 [Firmicutes bacterium ADurb.Bin193]|nr:MAG: hypothetical protein BWY15_01841 [Firmicutes bacterium ADurb.Bin193]
MRKKVISLSLAMIMLFTLITFADTVFDENKMGITVQASGGSAESDFDFIPSTGKITGYSGNGGIVMIPQTIGGVTVTTIGEYAFFRCNSLISVTIPNSVTTIEEGAFYSCENLTSVTILNSKYYNHWRGSI